MSGWTPENVTGLLVALGALVTAFRNVVTGARTDEKVAGVSKATENMQTRVNNHGAMLTQIALNTPAPSVPSQPLPSGPTLELLSSREEMAAPFIPPKPQASAPVVSAAAPPAVEPLNLD